MGRTFNRFCTHRPQDRRLPGADKISAVRFDKHGTRKHGKADPLSQCGEWHAV